MKLLEKILCSNNIHVWDDDNSKPFPGLSCSYCKICKEHIYHGALYLRGRWWGQGARLGK